MDSSQTRVAFFGHDVADAAVRRRVHALRSDGLAVDRFMMRREEVQAADEDLVDLGLTKPGAFTHRLGAIFAGAKRAVAARDRLEQADLIYARNLDMLACAFLAKRRTGLKTPVVYECLDVHRLMIRSDVIGWGLRWLERQLLSRSRLLVVSSPGFLEHYFKPRHGGHYRAYLLENRLAEGAEYGPRPSDAVPVDGEPFRLGWLGILRCKRSFDLLCAIADRFGSAISIELHGKPALNEIPHFHEAVAARDNIRFGGAYVAPDDLGRLYQGLDAVWAGDFMEAGYNSCWLLPNRIYEGGYYGVPPIAPAACETGRWIDARQCGLTVAESLETELPALIGQLIADRSALAPCRAALLKMDDDVFIQPRGTTAAIVRSALAPAGAVS